MEIAMSGTTEKLFKQFEHFIQENDNIDLSSEEDINQALKAFISKSRFDVADVETAYDYLELAESATTKKEALKYAKKLLNLNLIILML